MNFLEWWNPFTWASDILDSIVSGIVSGLNTALYFLSTFVYDLIIDLYNLFDILCKSRILDSATINKLSERVGLVLGLIMLFMVVISAIQLLLEPDKLTDSEKGVGNIIKKILIVVVMLGTMNSVFEMLYGAQRIIINSNVISKLLLPYNLTEEATKNFGGYLSANLFSAFYQVDESLVDKNELATLQKSGDLAAQMVTFTSDDPTPESCYVLTLALRKDILNKDGYNKGYACLNETDDDTGNNIIKYNGIFMLVFGIATAYFLFTYCITVGVRTIQLAFLEIISPMAIVSYLSPKRDTMFEKWWKIYFATYIDVFIRIAIINFVVFLIATIFENNGGWAFWASVEDSGSVSNTFIMVIMIMALLTFAKKAPDLLKKLFPAGESGLGFGTNEFGTGLLGFGIGAASGLIGGAVAGKGLGKLSGAATGLLRGGRAGMSVKKPTDLGKSLTSGYSKANAATMLNEQRIAAGGSRNPFMRMMSPMVKNRKESMIESNKQIIGDYNDAQKEAESEALKHASNYTYERVGHLANGKSLYELGILKDSQTITDDQRIQYNEAYDDLKRNATLFNLDNGRSAENAMVTLDKDGKVIGVQDLNTGYNVTDYSTIGAENSLIVNKMEAVARNTGNKLPESGSDDLKRAKAAKNARNQASNSNNEITNSASYRQASADSKYSGKK